MSEKPKQSHDAYELHHARDIWRTIEVWGDKFEGRFYSLQFAVYTINTIIEDEDQTPEFDHGTPYFTGWLKSDGCCNWTCESQNVHRCGESDFAQDSEAVKLLYQIGRRFMGEDCK